MSSLAMGEWTQPTYKEALAALKSRSSGWGHPIGIRNAAHWTLCPNLDKPVGVDTIACLDATCMQICKPG